MVVKSVYEKDIINSKTKKKFKGRLFYAIVPNHKKKTNFVYLSKANANEARGVTRVLPLLYKNWIPPFSVPRRH